MKITREQLKNIVREVMTEESEYQTFFKKALEKTGKSIPQMSDEEKKAFFNKIDAAWKGKGEKNERFGRGHEGPTFGSADEQVEELTKAQEKLPPALKKAIEKKEKNESVNEAKPKTKKEIESAINGLENYLKKNKYNDEVQKSIPPIIKKLQAQLKSVNEARTVSKPIKVDNDTMVQIVGDNKGFRELTAALNPKTGKPIQKFGFDRGNETAKSKEELIKKLQKKYGKSIKFESVNEESINEGPSTEEKRIALLAVRKQAKYRNVDLATAIQDQIRALEDLMRDAKKGKLK